MTDFLLILAMPAAAVLIAIAVVALAESFVVVAARLLGIDGD